MEQLHQAQSRISELEAQLAQAQARLNQNSRNSSRPPSSESPYSKPRPPSKKNSTRRRGRLPGHQGHEEKKRGQVLI